MANKRIEMLDLKHLFRLKHRGYSNRRIGQLLAIDRNTVNRYVHLAGQTGEDFKTLSSKEAEELAFMFFLTKLPTSERYEELSDEFEKLEKKMKKVGATYRTVWETYRKTHPEGYGYTQFRKYLKVYMKRGQVSMHWEHKYGEKLFVDFCGKKLPLTDPVSSKVIWKDVFVAVLGGSQYTYVEATDGQGLDAFLTAMQNAFHYFGGVSHTVVVDNLKAAVTKANKYEPAVNRNFKALALHYGTVILPTRAYKPKDKALVEGAVKLVYQRIFYPLNELEFFSTADLNRAILSQLDQYNNYPFQLRESSRREQFINYEKQYLLPLPVERYERKIYRRALVNKDSHVWFGPDKHFYSVPFQYIEKRVQIHASQDHLEVYAQNTYERIAIHRRSSKKGGFTTKAEHLPSNIRFVKDWSLEQFTEKAKEIGDGVFQYFQRIFEHKAHPEQACKACMGILSLRRSFSNYRIEAACRRADFFDNYSYRTVKQILEKGLDKVNYRAHARSDNTPIIDHSHPNIRGSDYYH